MSGADDLPAGFWDWARGAPARLLAVDYDGTLAPFALDPGAARPLAGSLAALAQIVRTRDTTVAIVTGRPISGLDAGTLALPVRVVGEHGWERRAPDGAVERSPGAAGTLELLARAAEEAAPAVAPAWVERKRTGVVVHTRALDPDSARDAQDRARDLFVARFADPRLVLRPVAGGLELRLRGRDKGTALDELAAELGAGAAVVYLGDDDTDEDAFRAARARGGRGILVGAPRATAAGARLAGPAEVARFLDEWTRRVGRDAVAAEAG